MNDKRHSPMWPPEDGVSFIRSQEFGHQLVRLVLELAEKYVKMDFADAIAKVYTWLDTKLLGDPHFISEARFPTEQSFAAYLRQAVWNAARLAERERKRFSRIKSLPTGQEMIVRRINPEEIAELAEAAESLPELQKTIFHRHFFDEEPLDMLTSAYDLAEHEAQNLYIEAIDMLREKLFDD